MFHLSFPLGTFPRRFRLIGLLLALLLVCSALFFLGGKAHAAPAPCCPGSFNPAAAVTYADNHWNWTAYNDSSKVSGGSSQTSFKCAEFVARALIVGKYIPRLNAYTSTQNALFNYQPGDGITYNLLAVTAGLAPPHHTLENYLTTFGLATNIGTNLSKAAPGDVVVYKDSSGTPQHMALIISVNSGATKVWVDAHNNAHFHVEIRSLLGTLTSYYILHLLQ